MEVDPPVSRTLEGKLQIRHRFYEKQNEFILNESIYRAFIAGRGSGKSYVGSYDLIARSKPGRLYLVVAPTYTVLQDVTMKMFIDVAKSCRALDVKSIKRSPPPSLKLMNGATVIFRSGDNPNSLRGPNLSGAWLDESGEMDEEVYKIVIAALREAGEVGWLTTTSTPKGTSHWTYEVFGSGKPDTALIQAATWENPFVHERFVSAVMGQYGHDTQWSKQEIEGQFIALEGAEWPPAYFQGDIWVDEMPDPLSLRILSVDPSKGRGAFGDYSAIIALGRGADGTLYVQADLDQNRDADAIVKRIIECHKAWTADVVSIESDAFQHLFAVLLHKESVQQGVIVPILETDTGGVQKEVRIRRLTPYLSRRNIKFVKDRGTELLVKQLKEFPVGDHDDGPDALEQAIRVGVRYWSARRDKNTKGYRA